MARNRISRTGRVAVGLAVLGSVVALASEIVGFRQAGAVDWGHVALALGVPVLMYGIVGGFGRAETKAPDDKS